MVKFPGGGGIPKIFVLQISQNTDGFRQNNSQGFRSFIKHYQQNPLDFFFFIFTMVTKGKTILWLSIF